MDDKKKKIEEVIKEVPEEVGEAIEEQEDEQKEIEEHVYLEKLVELEEKYKRALADYQNLQRRTQEEKREWARFSNKELLLKLLPILDTLMLAEKHTKDQNFILTVQQFLSALREEGVIKIKTVGEEFNPHTMEAVSAADGENNKVIEEVRAGYMLGDVVLRPAQVIVGK